MIVECAVDEKEVLERCRESGCVKSIGKMEFWRFTALEDVWC